MLLAPSLMLENLVSLGRETPFLLQELTDDSLLVAYGDGLTLFREEGGNWQPQEDVRAVCQACSTLQLSASETIVAVAGDGKLTLFDSSLQALAEATAPSPEEVIELVDAGNGRFLCVTEAQEVSAWQYADGELHMAGRWMVECMPLFGKGAKKPPMCEERGRLQERDFKTGTVLKTWSALSEIAWGISDPSGQQALVIHRNGDGSLLDLSGGEALFSFQTEFSLRSACFSPSGLGGALLGADGELALFRVTEGGATTELEVPSTPLMALCYHRDTLIGLDENGGLWRLGQEPESAGGQWAGWAMTSLWLESGEILLGTAYGTVEAFYPDGSRAPLSLQLHHDAVLSLDLWEGNVLSVGADATVCLLSQTESGWTRKTLATYPGRSVVGTALCPESRRLWLALDEGLLAWFDLDNSIERDEAEIPGRRIEEIRTAGPGAVVLLTDRGSVRRFSSLSA